MKYKIGDQLTFIYFGLPAKVNITEQKDDKFFCQNDGAYGGCWHSESEIDMEVEKYNKWVNDDSNGPTGHGDACFSDADSGL